MWNKLKKLGFKDFSNLIQAQTSQKAFEQATCEVFYKRRQLCAFFQILSMIRRDFLLGSHMDKAEEFLIRETGKYRSKNSFIKYED